MYISGVNVLQSAFVTEIPGLPDCFNWCGGCVGQMVGGMKPADVPGDAGSISAKNRARSLSSSKESLSPGIRSVVTSNHIPISFMV